MVGQDKMKTLQQLRFEHEAAALRALREKTPGGRRLNQLEDTFAEVDRVETERRLIKNYREEPEA